MFLLVRNLTIKYWIGENALKNAWIIHKMGFLFKDYVTCTNLITVVCCSMTSFQLCQLSCLCSSKGTLFGFFSLLLIPVTTLMLISDQHATVCCHLAHCTHWTEGVVSMSRSGCYGI
jgi:hypothetical protein